MFDKLKVWPTHQGGHIFQAAGIVIIQSDDVIMFILHQVGTQIRTQKTGPSGHENGLHQSSLAPFVIFVKMVVVGVFHFVDPCSRTCNAVEIETAGLDEFVQRNIAVVALDNLRFGLDSADNLADMVQFGGTHLRRFVQQNHVAELDLLDNQVLDIVLVQMLFFQAVASSELVPHTQGVHHGGDAVHYGHAVLGVRRSHGRIGTDSLRDRCGLANTAGLDDDIVEALRGHDVVQLLDEVSTKGATDASVLQGHERVVALRYYTALLDERSVNVYLAQVVYDYGEPDSLLILQNSV